ncbi:unnamed protein product [Protopolystoma xenopodis]|uniref:Uncharacterized protein n=1 Tax=Protopolystoma xenopodis TaxID=117903 RepID=A0A3S5BWC6_9PLAT|nr:unnamed protein product [Protopolystoma xenopodis]
MLIRLLPALSSPLVDVEPTSFEQSHLSLALPVALLSLLPMLLMAWDEEQPPPTPNTYNSGETIGRGVGACGLGGPSVIGGMNSRTGSGCWNLSSTSASNLQTTTSLAAAALSGTPTRHTGPIRPRNLACILVSH